MKILVGIKRVVDYNVKVQLVAAGKGFVPDIAHVKMSMNPFDEIALEEAVRLREKGVASEVVAVCVDSVLAQDVLRSALAAGADRAILLEVETRPEPFEIARIFAALIKKEQVSLALLGKQAIDDDSNQTGQILSALLQWGQAVFASKLQIENDKARVECETDKGIQTVSVSLPAVITADLRLNEPRYASLPAIMRARKKPIERLNIADLGINLQKHTEILAYAPPPMRKAGVKLADAAELLEKLQQTGLLSDIL